MPLATAGVHGLQVCSVFDSGSDPYLGWEWTWRAAAEGANTISRTAVVMRAGWWRTFQRKMFLAARVGSHIKSWVASVPVARRFAELADGCRLCHCVARVMGHSLKPGEIPRRPLPALFPDRPQAGQIDSMRE